MALIAASWPGRAQTRIGGIGGAALIVLIVAAAWIVPPMLDWGRFRGAIEAIAGAELGRKVDIRGEVALRLLPQAVLSATEVTLPDRGDGMSAHATSLRLEVAIWPLLTGRLVLRDLVLGSPVLTLPWPLPAGMISPERPRVPHAFAAHLENGTLRIGQAEITGITAAIHGGPEPGLVAGLVQDVGPVAAFGAEGFAAFDGQRWRFTTALGAPDADNVSAVDLALQGQAAARQTGGTIQGTLADGVIQGRLHAGGPDLSLLMPASALAWHAEAPFVASGEKIVTSALSLSLGGAPANATLTLRLASPSRLDARLAAASLDLDGWARLLSPKFAAFEPPTIPMRFDIAADTAGLLGGTLTGLSGALLFDGGHATLDHVQATLPGGARLTLDGHVTRAGKGPLSVDGPAHLDAPDLRATLAWLRPLAPALIDAMPAAVLRRATLAGTAHIAQSDLAVSGLAGTIDAGPVSGRFDLGFGEPTLFASDMTFEHLSIDDCLAGTAFHRGMSLAGFAALFTHVETALHLRARTADWGGQALTDVALDGSTGAAGLSITSLSGSVLGAKLSAAGTIGPDGTLAGGQAHAETPDLAKLFAHLPPAWRWAPGLWQGAGQLGLTAEGPPDDLALNMRADAADLVIEAESHRDTLAGTALTTLTLRHPGAPRLAAALGMPGAERWLDTGSLAVLAHLRSSPDRLSVQDFALGAAELRLIGHGEADFSGSEPAVTGDVVAETLALPGARTWQDIRLPPGWATLPFRGDIHLAAASVELDLQTVARDLSATLRVDGGDLLAEPVAATLAGGWLHAQLALDLRQEPAAAAVRAELTGATVAGPLFKLPVDLTAGSLDLSADLLAAGWTQPALLASLSGTMHTSLQGATLTGFDLGALKTLLAGRNRPPRSAVQAALSQGQSTGLSGTEDARIEHGRVSLAGTRLVSADGAVAVDGSIDLPTALVAVVFAPATTPGSHMTVKLAGIGHDAKAAVDPGARASKRRK